MRIDPSTIDPSPSTGSPLELAYALMREAEKQTPGEQGKFRAMDCHTDIMDLALDHRSVSDAVHNLGMFGRICTNQERLGI